MPWEPVSPPSQIGGFTFEGEVRITLEVASALSLQELNDAVTTIRSLVRRWGTIDYQQVLVNYERELVLICVDCIRAELRGSVPTESDHWYMAFAGEVSLLGSRRS